jgi:hypothetical protein
VGTYERVIPWFMTNSTLYSILTQSALEEEAVHCGIFERNISTVFFY